MNLKIIKLQVRDSESVSHSVCVFHFSFLLLIFCSWRQGKSRLHNCICGGASFIVKKFYLTHICLGLENSQHFTTPSLVSPRNEVWEGTTAEIPYWWPVTTQIWVVLLIGWKIASSDEKRYSILGSDTASVWNFYAHSSDVILREHQWWRREMLSGYSGCHMLRFILIADITM